MDTSYIERFLYDSDGHTGKTYYWKAIQRNNGYVWDPTNKQMVDQTTITWEDATTTLAEEGTTGRFPIRIPANFPAGGYDIVIYEQAGSVPQNTDDVTKQYEFVNGSIFGF